MEKGIVFLDMPKGCLECEHRNTYFRCYFTNKSVLDFCRLNNLKPDFCPIREIPKALEE